MSDPPTLTPAEANARDERDQRRDDGTLVSTGLRYVERGLRSGAFAGLASVLTLVRVRRALRDGATDDAIRRTIMAVFWIGTAVTQRRSRRASAIDPAAAEWLDDPTEDGDTSSGVEIGARHATSPPSSEEISSGTSIPIEESNAGGDADDSEPTGERDVEGRDEDDDQRDLGRGDGDLGTDDS